MKKAILLFACMGTMFCSFAQETPSETSGPPLTKEAYLQKSKRQRTLAIVMISGGGALFVEGADMVLKNTDFGFGTPTKKNEALSVVLVIAGAAAIIVSIGLFVSVHDNKKKALSIAFKYEPVPILQGSMVFCKSVPSLNLKIRL